MAESKYKKYVSRNAMKVDAFMREHLVGTRTMPPMTFLNGDIPVKGANQFVEAMWVWAPNPVGTGRDTPPHVHDFDEVFMWLGSDPQNPTDLGAEVEVWLGEEGEERDKVTFNTSTVIFVPKGLRHLPIIYKRVDSPVLQVVFGINSGPWEGYIEGGGKISSVS